MPGGGHERREEVVITGEGIVKRCPARLSRRGDVLEPEYGTMQVGVYCVRYIISYIINWLRVVRAP